MNTNFGKNLYQLSHMESRSICAENFTGEKGGGGKATTGTGEYAARELGVGWKISPSIEMKPGEVFELANIKEQGIIKHIWIVDSCEINRRLILRIYWDGNDFPSVETPLCDFFASADYQKYAQLTSQMVCVNPKRAFNCYWEMPFKTGCRMTLENIASENVLVYYQIDYEIGEIPENSAYFHAQFRRTNPVKYMEDYTILDNISGVGHYVGTYLFWGVKNNNWWGEGEMKFFIDNDTEYPTICGTGTEDYFGGSYNFDIGGEYKEYCTPYCGLSKVIRGDGLYGAQQRFSMYRWHICDPIHFKENIRVTVQALGWRSEGRYLPLQDDISSVAYFYLKDPTTVQGTLPDKNGLEII